MKKNLFVDLLGKTAKDKVTGFVGVVVTVSFDLFGCVQVILKPPIDKDGKLGESHWFDVNRIEVTNHTKVMESPMFGSTPEKHDHGPSEKPRGKHA